MSDAAMGLRTARGVGANLTPHAHAYPIHKLHTDLLHSTVEAGRTISTVQCAQRCLCPDS